MLTVIASAAMSVDGHIDDGSPERLVLSSPEDLAEVHRLRARSDAILVGAGTLRKDNASLVTRDAGLREWRVARGMPPDPVKVTVTASGELDARLAFFRTGAGEKLVYCPDMALAGLSRALAGMATVIGLGARVSAAAIVEDLAGRGIGTLLVEGGSAVHTMFLGEDRVDELRLAVAPFFVGDASAPRFVNPAHFPFARHRKMQVRSVALFGDTAAIHFALPRGG